MATLVAIEKLEAEADNSTAEWNMRYKHCLQELAKIIKG